MIDLINLDFENVVYPTIAVILSNIITYVVTKKHYQDIKKSFFEFCDIPQAIKEAWKDDIVTKDEIIKIAKEIKEFADSLKKVI